MTAKSPHTEAILELRSLGFSSAEIGKKLGLTSGRVRSLWRTPEQRNRERQKRRERQQPQGQGTGRVGDYLRYIPDDVLAERAKRIELEHTSVTAALMGDPLPGFSALDKMR